MSVKVSGHALALFTGVLFVLFCSFSAHAQDAASGHREVAALRGAINRIRNHGAEQEVAPKEENPRAVAIALTVALGPFGAHRIYLGTSGLVPVFYTATLGGGLGILPLIDLGHLIFVKDITPFIDNDQVFMWSGQKK